jgi:hypothetical protein
MHDDVSDLCLAFPSLPRGDAETELDLTRLLYRTGALLTVDEAAQAIELSALGSVLPERVELVRLAHGFIADALAGGGSPFTARQQIKELVRLFGWAENAGATMSLGQVQKIYLDWSEHLLERVRVRKELKPNTAYNYARIIGQVLDGVLERPTPLIELTRLKRPPVGKKPQGATADKQRLDQTFAFGRLLQGICDGLPLSFIRGPRKSSITLQDGSELHVGRRGNAPSVLEKREAYNVRASAALALAYENDQTLDHGLRRDLVNLRIQAELLVFIGQTGMNLTQGPGTRTAASELHQRHRRLHGEGVQGETSR